MAEIILAYVGALAWPAVIVFTMWTLRPRKRQ